ncbi:hypothetical protein ACX3O0_15700 [Homoserinimonas sp. A447]
MEHDGWAGSHRRNLGLLLALVALTAGPLALPATATATPSSAATGITADTAAPAAESPSDTALRTSSTLAATVIGTVVLVGLFWYLVVRSRRK